jgi:peptide chain release factor 2
MAAPDFWSEQQRAQGVVQQVKQLRTWLEPFDALDARVNGAAELETLLAEQPDPEIEREAERRGYGIDILDLSEGEEAGIKGAVLEIKGEYAFGFLRPETGVHRLVRISPFDAQSRRHTSFASVFVYPVVNEEINIEIRDEDIRMDVFRASGAGGQHVNKTSSAVRLTHIPSGVVVASQQERSQFKNKATAMKMLKNRLYQLEAEKQAQLKAALDATKADVTFGSQIRSYVFQPYTMVNDHRTELKIPDVQKVMDGGIDPFIEAYLHKAAGGAADAA